MSFQNQAPADRRSHVADQLCGLLTGLVALRSEAGADEVEISLDTDFTSLALNSVDFLEFVLLVEQEFGVEIPDDALTERRLLSLSAWADYLTCEVNAEG